MSTTTVSVRRAWIIAGAVLFQLMVLIAAFSLGVYVERYGFTRDGLSYAGPGGPPVGPGGPGGNAPGPINPQGNQPGGAPPVGAPQLPLGLEEPPQLIGLVQRISPDGLDLATPEGPRHVLIDEATAYENIDSARIPASDLRPGMVVAIYGEFTEGGRNLLAGRVVIIPPKPDQQPPP